MKTPENPGYTRYHPRWHREGMPVFWWTRKAAYMKFVLRELTSVAVGYSIVLLLVHMWLLGRGPESHAAFQEWLVHPVVLSFHGLVFAGLVYHSVTWLTLAPKAIALKVGGRRVPGRVVRVSHQILGVLTFAGVLWLLLGR